MILALKSSSSACWNRPLGQGRDFRGFRGRGGLNYGGSPKYPGEGRIRGRFSGGGRGRSWGQGRSGENDNDRFARTPPLEIACPAFSVERFLEFTRVILTCLFYPGKKQSKQCRTNQMSDYSSTPCTAFEGGRQLRSGPLGEVALAVKAAVENGSTSQLFVFDDMTGHLIDLDLRGSKEDIVERLRRPPEHFAGHYASHRGTQVAIPKDNALEPRGRGRPKLGVVSREVTLLPKQWEWLASQPGGASAMLRRLVNEARRTSGPQQKKRAAQEAAYHFMHAIAGDIPGYEEAIRALFASDPTRLKHWIATWPEDIQAYIIRLAFASHDRIAPK
ncbi:MAG: hypothetical protein B193_3539 [Solidesulfovibrio magneticus str. Maddingley MBC34]|uniref:DUF2239 domain-containing protein n=1 Tax=Solidesulfovibrio magneticus str. Maddingley MBC34 TaxID=1206767 RepID=K6G9K9_9BACT|nr:MAG: hypothetical protein B193_3539 [Solidesulfovibrio magneticus str. Maddingley MBC34]